MARPAGAVEPVEVAASDLPAVRGFLHRPARPSGDGLVLTHGAGGNCRAPLLADLAGAFADHGVTVLRCDLPFRQVRAAGPPSPNRAGDDRAGLRHAVEVLRGLGPGRLFLGGASYGGRQASILAAAEPGLVDALLLISYPLHPPARPSDLRVEHFPRLRTPVLFVHGDRDPFGSLEELDTARALVAARTALVVTPGGHDLGYGCSGGPERGLGAKIVEAFRTLAAAG